MSLFLSQQEQRKKDTLFLLTAQAMALFLEDSDCAIMLQSNDSGAHVMAALIGSLVAKFLPLDPWRY
jgi:hypothetical protein